MLHMVAINGWVCEVNQKSSDLLFLGKHLQCVILWQHNSVHTITKRRQFSPCLFVTIHPAILHRYLPSDGSQYYIQGCALKDWKVCFLLIGDILRLTACYSQTKHTYQHDPQLQWYFITWQSLHEKGDNIFRYRISTILAVKVWNFRSTSILYGTICLNSIKATHLPFLQSRAKWWFWRSY